MGLKSLPMLNKSGISMYWSNIWDSIKLYKKYSLGFLYLNDVLYYFLNENLYYYCIMRIRRLDSDYRGLRGYKHININKLKKSWNMRNFYLGKILFFNNQGWIIILINYFNSKRGKLYQKYKNSKVFKKLFKSLRFNTLRYTYKLDKYKYKF
uniref:Ribosomal protein S3 n=1 Tax=Tetrahymena pigmentosa TaxID=5907 RepID=Q09F33_TETPI|nr:ribosomal protein S3 [Tetrahymena pigmentosa]ABI51718.1 ribosomal protein S3 [Tetrahymena pigmentosa]